MKVLVTGGAGFLGSHLCGFLTSKGHSVIGLDNLITGKIANIQHLTNSDKFKFIQQDVSDFIPIEGEIDYVLHFASPASPIDFLNFPIQTLKAGALGTHNALGLAKVKGAKFLLASSSEVYGDALISPQKEEYWGNVNPIGPRSVYDEAKRFGEAITMAYHRQHNIDTRIARIFNTYGPRMRKSDGRVIPNFITQALSNEPVTVFGTGAQTRSFCYVSDLVAGIYSLMLSDVNEPINLGNPQEITILEMAKKIIELVGSRSQIVYKPLPEDDPRSRQPDITKARNILHWQPEVPLDKGIKETVEWFKDKQRA